MMNFTWILLVAAATSCLAQTTLQRGSAYNKVVKLGLVNIGVKLSATIKKQFRRYAGSPAWRTGCGANQLGEFCEI